MAWYDFFRLFAYANRKDPISRKEDQELQGAGISAVDVPDIRGGIWGDGNSPLNIAVDGSDFIDMNTMTNRLNRYKEYDRLQSTAEIENALTTFADEACQEDEEGFVFQVRCENPEVKEELELLLHTVLELDDTLWSNAKSLYKYGDHFWEIVVDPEDPKAGVQKIASLPADSMFRIETIRGRVMEFQQSKQGPDYQSLTKLNPLEANKAELDQATAIRFHPDQIIHMRIGDDRKTFYPYGVSMLEAARGPAHQLHLMEDAMLVYRLVRAPERRVFYVDVGTLPPFRAEAYMERIRDQFRKKKVFSRRSTTGTGASAVDERMVPPSAEEDFWIPIRPNSATKIDTLPGACLSLDTKIPLLDGRTLTLSEIIAEHEQGKKLWAYSCNPKTGEVVPGLITWAGVTRKDAKVMRMTLDNGQSITCTPDHKFPIPDRGFVEAKDLIVGDRFFPFNTRKEKIRKSHRNTYTQVYDNASKTWKFVHRMVCEFAKNTDLYQEHVFAIEHANDVKNLIHHKDFNRYNNDPYNLTWMSAADHRKLHASYVEWFAYKGTAASVIAYNNLSDDEKAARAEKSRRVLKNAWDNNKDSITKAISAGLKAFHQGVDREFYNRLTAMSKSANARLRHLLTSDTSFRTKFLAAKKEGWNKFVGTDAFEERSKKIGEANKQRWSKEGYKEKVFAKQTLVLPRDVFNFVVDCLRMNLEADVVAEKINSDTTLKQSFLSANTHIKRKGVLESGIAAYQLKKMVSQYGYKNWRQLKNEVRLYNHQIVSIEYLTETQDTGTLTIDGQELYHNYHTFALQCGIFTKNSNLGEIDDAVYFRQKLYTALQFPKNYLQNSDPQATKLTLSQQDTRFARLIERLQKPLAKAIKEVALRHLRLRGWPEEEFKDLKIKITPPSDWRRINRNEVEEVKYNRAATLKGSQMMSDYDILTRILDIEPDDAKEIVARMKAQKVDDLKMQLAAANPTLLGFETPEQQGTPIGTAPGGPNPNLGDQPPGGETPPQPGQEQMGGEGEQPEQPNLQPGAEQQTQAVSNLPEPSEEEIRKYGLEIRDYKQGFDDEEVDDAELGDGI